MERVRLGFYEVVSELGVGGMGKVYLAEVTEPAAGLDKGERVALKVIHPHLLSLPGFFKRFLLEAQVGRQVQHENVVRTYDCDATLMDGVQQNYLVMEYVEGQTLRDLLKELERVPEELCRHIGREVAQGLSAIHEAGVLHRDIKPENVLITEEHVVKVMDLGVARLQDAAIRLSQADSFVGSPEYAAPEQFHSSDGEPDERADLHALGVLLYELSTGLHPYRDEDSWKVLRNVLDVTPRKAGEVNPQLSPFFEEVVSNLLAKKREQRFGTASDLALALEEGEDGDWWKERAKALRVATRRPLRRVRIARETTLYGRDDELVKLSSLYEMAKAGDGQVLLLEGEAGIGKTRLVDEFVGRLQQQGEDPNFLFGSYPPGGAATAAGAFSTAYREQFGEEGIEDAVREYLAATPLLVPAFSALLKGDATPADAERLTKESLQTVFVHATRGLAAERPTIVLIDDLHFAPEDGRALFASLALAVPEHRILLVGTMRPGIPSRWTANVERHAQASRLVIPRLGPKHLGKLLVEAFQSERLATQLGFQIATKSDGNPFFAFEIVRGLRDRQLISQGADGTWISTQEIRDIQIPSSVTDLIEARLGDLTEEEKDLLDVASCCGFEFDPLLVATVLGLAQIPAMKLLARIEKQHRLVRSSGRRYAFDHYQVHEWLYTGMPELLREPYHAAIAAALEAREKAADADPEALEGALCVDLCEHFLKGAQGESALRYLDAALEYLEASYLNDRAIDLMRLALAVPGLLSGKKRVEVLLRQGARFDILARRDEQGTVFQEALAVALEVGDGALEARVRILRGALNHRLASYEDAIEEYERALELSAAAEDASGEASATANLGSVCKDMGRLAESQELYTRAVALARACGDRQLEISATGNLGVVFRNLGRFAEAKEHYERWLRVARELGQRRGEAMALGNLGIVYKNLGRFAEARDCYWADLELSREVGDRRSQAITLVNLGPHQARLGDMTAAAETLAESLTMAREIGARRVEGYGLHAQGNLALAQGDTERAQQRFEAALAVRREIGYPSGIGQTVARLGHVAVREGRMEDATQHFDEALAIARKMNAPDLLVTAAVDRTLVPGGDVAVALEAFEQHEPRLGSEDKMELRFILWRVTGERVHLEAAHEIFVRILEHAPPECREAMVANCPLHRDIVKAWEAEGTAGRNS